MSALHLLFIDGTMVEDDGAHVLSCQSLMQFRQGQEEYVLGSFQASCAHQFLADGPEFFADMCQQQDYAEFWHLTQACQISCTPQEEADPLAIESPLHAGCSLGKLGDHCFGFLRSPLELDVRCKLRIFEVQVVGKRAKDMRGIFSPAR